MCVWGGGRVVDSRSASEQRKRTCRLSTYVFLKKSQQHKDALVSSLEKIKFEIFKVELNDHWLNSTIILVLIQHLANTINVGRSTYLIFVITSYFYRVLPWNILNLRHRA